MSKPKWPERPVYDGGEIFIAAVAGAYLVFKRAGANVITLGTKYVKEDAFALAENARNDSEGIERLLREAKGEQDAK